MPIVFVREKERYAVAAVLGLERGENLYLAANDRWIGAYIPSVFRAYPFGLSKIVGYDDRYALSVDMNSGLVGEEHEIPFFETNGNLSQPVQDILSFLLLIKKDRKLAIRICAALDTEGLIVPWEISVNGKDGQTKINDLYRIDEAKLNSLDPVALARLHQAGALPVAYCQLISMQHIHTLAKLADAHAKIEAQQHENPNAILAGDFFGSDGKIDFSGFN